jgi:hypothetical protein
MLGLTRTTENLTWGSAARLFATAWAAGFVFFCAFLG